MTSAPAPEPPHAERLDRFMARAAAAYYAARDPFGAAGDFTTAPEISQAFGECLGLWAAVTWELMGRPDPVLLVEPGPGRGTLMADALRAAAEVARPFRRAARVHLVETSPRLRDAQRARLGDAVAAWHEDVAALPPGPAILLANEFLDALPIRQFVRRGAEWRERWVRDGAFLERPIGEDAPPLPAEAPEGAVLEVNELARALAAALGARLAAQGGAALILDYGPAEGGFGDSLQAVRAHARADPLAQPGSADLTAHVDFAALAAAARAAGAAVHGPLPQGVFLQRLGLASRAAMLAATQPAQAAAQLAAAHRLMAPEGMGRLFKALCLCHPGLPTPPPGFEFRMSVAEFLAADLLAGLRHAFFTRRGGLSGGPFATLNCSLNGKDDREAVRANRARAMDALGLPPAALLGLHQVHGAGVVAVPSPGAWGEADRPQADALVTDRPGVALGVVTADCAPVLFADAEAGVIGAAHAGWRGAVLGVLEATVAAMERLGAVRARIAAAIGPCIRQPSYEVGPDLRGAVLARDPADERFFSPGRREARWQFDLPGYCAARLAAAGLRATETLAADTLADEARFFSHRRNTLAGGGPIGHQLSAIALAPA